MCADWKDFACPPPRLEAQRGLSAPTRCQAAQQAARAIHKGQAVAVAALAMFMLSRLGMGAASCAVLEDMATVLVGELLSIEGPTQITHRNF